MTHRHYQRRCKCKEKLLITKKRKVKKRRKEKIHQYPDPPGLFSKTFQIRSQKNLSLTTKSILNNFKNKYIYYAIDDILYMFNSSIEERDYLLEILYSPLLSLHNNFSINFFEIWISEIYIAQLGKSNRFLNSKHKILDQETIINLKLLYKIPIARKKQESIW